MAIYFNRNAGHKMANLAVSPHIRAHQHAYETHTKQILPICESDMDSPNEKTGFQAPVTRLPHLRKKQKEFG